MKETVVPYKHKSNSKKAQVAEMFDNISHRYDFLNHVLSLGIDKLWRRKAVNLLRKSQPKMMLDVACGTGDFALECLRLNPDKVIGIDISHGMLRHGNNKVEDRNLSNKVELIYGDSENIPFEEDTFDAMTVGFGVRNFENLKKGLTEMRRVLKTGGTAVILEFSKPKAFPIKQIYGFYFHKLLPRIGKTVSNDASAYTYLPESVEAFPEGEDFCNILTECAYRDVKRKALFFGVATIYTGIK
ncbi:MAG: bifunctional demethylmenaquinone methyltransferase/2-methoxy-6-polyprenyl-1,4-benzoquinol methylase UbiE [Verrucomicrobia bacterium]|nr:bifunctional demethylmenaquinone methyltransferase/2-methoxy-6-polyprenyl-1,4-benzoquinol methylase UbiE [Verrucomicrobiota bacterium]|tara:strand:- start:119 stop:847 length:729 start_codon:yes stop_codon:yes gene_type:complete